MIRILGIDPGTKRVGYGLVEKKDGNFFPLDYGCLESSLISEGDILEDIFCKISDIIKKYEPDIVSIEKLFFFKNQKTIISVSQSRGVMILACRKLGKRIIEPTPLQIKTCLTSYGRADKKAVAEMVKRLLKLDKLPKLDDTTDALACALTSFYLMKD